MSDNTGSAGADMSTTAKLWKPGEDERSYFEDFVRVVGKQNASPTIVYMPTVDDGHCWSGAWEHAQRHELTYVEGRCGRPMEDGTIALHRAHAWAEQSDGTVVELTRGYDNTVWYQGFGMSPRPGGPADRATQIFAMVGEGRFSVIEWLVTQGWTLESIWHLLKERS